MEKFLSTEKALPFPLSKNFSYLELPNYTYSISLLLLWTISLSFDSRSCCFWMRSLVRRLVIQFYCLASSCYYLIPSLTYFTASLFILKSLSLLAILDLDIDRLSSWFFTRISCSYLACSIWCSILSRNLWSRSCLTWFSFWIWRLAYVSLLFMISSCRFIFSVLFSDPYSLYRREGSANSSSLENPPKVMTDCSFLTDVSYLYVDRSSRNNFFLMPGTYD